MTDAFVFDAVRTPRGKAKDIGALHDQRPIDLAATVMRAVVDRTGIDAAHVDDVVLGCVTQVGDQGANLARIAAVYCGWDAAGGTVNRFCASGLDACNQAAAAVMTGTVHLVVAGGVESMSRVPMFSDRGAWFADPEVAGATRFVHMGVAADLVATRAGLTRDELDAYAVESHHRAAAARDAGRFERSLVPVGDARRDELIRDGASIEAFGALPPAFADQRRPEGVGSIESLHTVATSPGMADGAAAVLIGGAEVALPRRARIVAMATATVDPVIMLTGNVDACRRALGRAGLQARDIDVFEVNESFAAVPLAFARELDVDPARLNPNGGAIAMGHPLGATGAILLGSVVDELARTGGRYGVASICGGAGIATATIVERL